MKPGLAQSRSDIQGYANKIATVTVIYSTAFLLLAFLLSGELITHCGRSSFGANRLAPHAILIIASLMLVPVPTLGLWAYKKRSFMRGILPIVCLIGCSGLWLDYTSMVACFVDEGIRVRANSYGPDRLMSWREVEQVSSMCWRDRSGPHAAAILQLHDKERFRVAFYRGIAAWARLQRALTSVAFTYVSTPISELQNCPKEYLEMR